jgi:hypothetical protein
MYEILLPGMKKLPQIFQSIPTLLYRLYVSGNITDILLTVAEVYRNTFIRTFKQRHNAIRDCIYK